MLSSNLRNVSIRFFFFFFLNFSKKNIFFSKIKIGVGGQPTIFYSISDLLKNFYKIYKKFCRVCFFSISRIEDLKKNNILHNSKIVVEDKTNTFVKIFFVFSTKENEREKY